MRVPRLATLSAVALLSTLDAGASSAAAAATGRAPAGPAPAAVTRVAHDAVAAGGRSSAGGLRLIDTIGETVAGVSAAAAIRLRAGYAAAAHRYLVDAPTALTFAALSAEAGDHGVVVAWTVGSADGLVGFRVYRSRRADGGFEDVSGVLPARGPHRFTDRGVEPGTIYHYRVGGIDREGEILSRAVEVTTPTWVTELGPNVPNPFNPVTTIPVRLARTGPIDLAVYDARGRRVRTLARGVHRAGAFRAAWDGRDDRGEPVATGVYFCRLRAGDETVTRKMTLLK